ncbi:hypothetical protein C8Q80DRAFT_1189749 [Daedaleopsis nitida]|nr:hypothetical protein C8Q80DRAFT_1189749 [Daedaleopsis nitida]
MRKQETYTYSQHTSVESTKPGTKPGDDEDLMAYESGFSSDMVMSKPQEGTLSITDLPPEILSCIFQIVQDITGWTGSWEDDAKMSTSWIRLSWVCRHWRQVAVTTPLLWNRISDHQRSLNYSWVPVFLDRAASAPLHVKGRNQGHRLGMAILHPSSLVLHHLPPYTSSVLSFHFEVSGHRRHFTQSLEALLLPILTQMCSLESLRLHDHRTVGTGTIGFPGLTREHLPRLRSLVLIGICFPWTSSLYTSLRSLTVQWCEIPLPMSELIRILESSPNLKSLSLSHCLTLIPDPSVYQIPPISLPKLCSINIRGTSAVTSFICKAISAPILGTADIHYDVPVAEVDMDVLKDIIPAQTLFRPLLTQAKRLLLNMRDYSLCLRLSKAPDGPHRDECPTDEPTLICVVGKSSDNSTAIDAITPRAWSAMLDVVGSAAPNLTCLRLRFVAVSSFDRDMWQQCFTSFLFLEHLEVGNCATRTIQNANEFAIARDWSCWSSTGC